MSQIRYISYLRVPGLGRTFFFPIFVTFETRSRDEIFEGNRKTHAFRTQEISRGLREVKAVTALGNINNCNNKWLQRVRRMDRSGHPDAVVK
jgi:hypothetical protein